MDNNDHLLHNLFELASVLKGKSLPLIIGGGLGLYLRAFFLPGERQNKYRLQVERRSTKDMVVFLSGDIIINECIVSAVRDALTKLKYIPKTKYFQFEKTVENNKLVEIDILSPISKDEMIEINGIRIKNKNVKEFHARGVPEAEDIDFGKQQLKIKQDESNIFVPSSINYLILKLHAFNDRINDPNADYGRHHAYDIFTCITDMGEEDWENTKTHFQKFRNKEYLKNSTKLQKDFFENGTSPGVIRLRENQLYKRYKEEYDNYVADFLIDIKDIFSI